MPGRITVAESPMELAIEWRGDLLLHSHTHTHTHTLSHTRTHARFGTRKTAFM